MTKSETNSPQSIGDKLDAPVQLTPEELEAAAGGMRAQITPVIKGGDTVTTGAAPTNPLGNPTAPLNKY